MDYLQIIILVAIWHFYHKSIKMLFPGTDNRSYANAVSITHSVIVTSMSTIFLFIGCEDEITNGYLYLFSLTYFVYDLCNCLDDKLFIVHHLIGITILLSSSFFFTPEYSRYTNLMIIISEVTNPCQNFFFLMKNAYGENHKKEFYTRYMGLFVVFSSSFAVCRLLLAPLTIYLFISIIKEKIYYYTIFSCAILIIVGSAVWLKGQRNMISKMKLMSKK